MMRWMSWGMIRKTAEKIANHVWRYEITDGIIETNGMKIQSTGGNVYETYCNRPGDEQDRAQLRSEKNLQKRDHRDRSRHAG